MEQRGDGAVTQPPRRQKGVANVHPFRENASPPVYFFPATLELFNLQLYNTSKLQ